MGADGHWYLMRKVDFLAKFPDVKPEDAGLSEVKVLGVAALSAYDDTDGRDDFEYAKTGLAIRADRLRWWVRRIKTQGENGVLVVKQRNWSYRTREVYETETYKLGDYEPKLDAIETDPEYPYQCRVLEAVEWFKSEAEDHCVWT
jgi:hypothetical protein